MRRLGLWAQWSWLSGKVRSNFLLARASLPHEFMGRLRPSLTLWASGKQDLELGSRVLGRPVSAQVKKARLPPRDRVTNWAYTVNGGIGISLNRRIGQLLWLVSPSWGVGAALSIAAKRWKQPTCPSRVGEWITTGPSIQWNATQPRKGSSDACYSVNERQKHHTRYTKEAGCKVACAVCPA